MKDLIGKTFIYREDKWIVKEILLHGHRCICRNCNTNTTKQFYTHFIEECIAQYEYSLEQLEKKRYALVLKEDNEKALFKKMVKYYCDNVKLSELTDEDYLALVKIKKKIQKYE